MSTQPFAVPDLFLNHHVTEIQCSAATAACTVKSVDVEQDQHVSCIWTFALDGSAARQLTRGPGQDSAPRWSPDGTQLAFISTRTGTSQVFVIDPAGGEARQVGTFPQGISDLRWFPSGTALLVCAAVEVDPDLRGARALGRKPTQKKCRPELAWRLPYKEDGVGFLLQREFHLFRLALDCGERSQLTDGAFDVLAFDVSADGSQIAYARTREGRFAHCNDLWVCAADGGRPRRLTAHHAIVMQPHWSPDGRSIAFTGATDEGDAEPVLWLFDVDSAVARPLCQETVDVADPVSMCWDDDGASLVFSRAHRGCHQIAALRVQDQSVTVMAGGDRQLSAFCATPSHLVYAVDHPSQPSEVWVMPRSGAAAVQNERQLSRLNPWWDARDPIETSSISFEVPDGRGGKETVQGWLLRRRGSTGPQPLLCDIHGGPASYALLDFDTNVYWHTLCAAGWSVLALNAVGSASFGREFCKRLAGRWGELDLPQYLAAIGQLREQGLCDERVAVSGKSYGGFLSAYATGNSGVFQAAVVMAPVGNIETHYGTSDGGYYADPFYMGSQPVFDRELARKLSPLQHIEKSSTPTLFMQGKEDERCPKCQSEELFVSLARASEVPTELVLYPGETHGFLASGAPSCREDAALRIVDWLERHVRHRYIDPATRAQPLATTA
ncbi:S9 family peptidase [Pseudorhodoferax soli]|uniref:Dipeptidyl aminopeptidase/acylaminoacyl peptidase n=1 Tax=Pseudorhodoferax soli TaxID=545864 RepID=A0A368XTG5_9BURK|nr:S9 family peptidase [Pseudorhodoferax soli]RCW70338.1 dipeptidyl aminopeptidase/acylaminoacyl peptidase [Pseudorhodoferax soli]